MEKADDTPSLARGQYHVSRLRYEKQKKIYTASSSWVWVQHSSQEFVHAPAVGRVSDDGKFFERCRGNRGPSHSSTTTSVSRFPWLS